MRPEDVLTALRQIAGLSPASSPAVTRVAQGAGDDRTDGTGTGTGAVACGGGARPAGHPGPAGRGRTAAPALAPGQMDVP